MSDLFIDKQKKRTFTNCLTNPFDSRLKYLKNQQSLLGSIFCVMVDEKLIISIVKVFDKDQKCKSIPIQFKVNEKDIPSEIDAFKLQRKNLINITIGNSDPIPSLVVAIGDDSGDLMRCYHRFVEFSKSTKMPPIESKTIRCLNLEGIKIKSSGAKFLVSIPIEKFNNFIKLLDEMKKKQNLAKYNLRSKTPPPKKEERFNAMVVDVSSEEDTPRPSTSRIKTGTTPKKVKSKPDESSTPKQSSKSRESMPQSNARIISKILKLADIVEPMESSRVKQFCEQSIKILHTMAKNLNKDLCIKEDCSIRIIPEIDETVIREKITVIEGILPVYTNRYKKAIYQKSLKVGDTEPTIILANFVRYAFPPHWIHNVTIRGSGGRKSLISLWNYKNPLKTVVDGQSIPGLGEKRFRALLDHIVRKCGKKSYDKGTEKQLISCFAKAMHYARTRMVNYSKKDTKKDEDSSESDSDNDSTCSEGNGNDGDSFSIEFTEEILCTPDLKDYDYEIQESDDGDDNESTKIDDSGESDSNADEDHSDSKKADSSEHKRKIKKSSTKCPEKQSRNNTEILESSKKLNDNLVVKDKNVLNQTHYYSQPVQTTKRAVNDSMHTPNMKKAKKYEESGSRKKEVKNQEDSKAHEILSQDESQVNAQTRKMNEVQDDNHEKDDEGDDDVFSSEVNDSDGSNADHEGDESSKE